jgi:hypothetical protein
VRTGFTPRNLICRFGPTRPSPSRTGFYVDYRGGSLFVPFEIFFCAADECPDWLDRGPMP